jgi:glutathione S-transferase
MSLILHHYDFSNYSEKIRVALGFKGLEWSSVIVPPVLPKPDLTALTGGYRRAPVLQIGADIYCDTRLILRQLEKSRPQPALFEPGSIGVANAIAAWAEGPLFHSVMLYAWGTNYDLMPRELIEDRARMRGLRTPSIASVQRAAERHAPLVRLQLPFIEDMLADGRRWVCGSAFSAADLSVYHALWFLTDRSSRLAHELEPFRRIKHWMARIREMGHGRHNPLSATAAVDIARSADPAPVVARCRQPEDPELDSEVAVRAADYARDAVIGRLDFADADEISVRIFSGELGEVAVHFPRIGFELRPAAVS